jgi:Domain of unknown function (DUF2019)
MSAENLAELSTEELVRRFAETAKATRSAHTRDRSPDALKGTPERKARVAEMQALGAELRARKPIAHIRMLLEDENRDVRSWAAGQFNSIDPEGALAAWGGLCYDFSTRETLEFTRRVRRRPPSKPPLKDMSDDELIARFEDAATREYGRRFIDYIGDPVDMAILNRIIGEVVSIRREAKARGLLERLVPLMDHRLITVRREAASACLGVAPERAEALLEAIKGGRDMEERPTAWTTLDNWRSATLAGRDWPP